MLMSTNRYSQREIDSPRLHSCKCMFPLYLKIESQMMHRNMHHDFPSQLVENIGIEWDTCSCVDRFASCPHKPPGNLNRKGSGSEHAIPITKSTGKSQGSVFFMIRVNNWNPYFVKMHRLLHSARSKKLDLQRRNKPILERMERLGISPETLRQVGWDSKMRDQKRSDIGTTASFYAALSSHVIQDTANNVTSITIQEEANGSYKMLLKMKKQYGYLTFESSPFRTQADPKVLLIQPDLPEPGTG